MSIRFQCPHCDASLAASEGKAGSAMKCPQCFNEVNVPRLPAVSTGGGSNVVVWASLAAVCLGLGVFGIYKTLIGKPPAPQPAVVQSKPKLRPEPEKQQPGTPIVRNTPRNDNPKKDEPKKDEPKQNKPQTQEPKKDEPKQSEPKQSEPKKDEPKQSEPKKDEPKQSEPKKEPVVSERKFKRIRDRSAEELRKELLLAPEVSLDANPQHRQMLLTSASQLRTRGMPFPGPALLFSSRPDLVGLPIRMGADCHLSKEAAENLQVLSRALRVHLETAAGGPRALDPRPDPDKLRDLLVNDRKKEWLKPAAVPALMQLLQAESAPIRKLLVELLDQIEGNEATQALCLRALTDLEPEIREAACACLKKRPKEQFRQTLVQGLRYPWSAVREHAAEALAFLDCQECVPDMIRLLTLPDVRKPISIKTAQGTRPHVPQLVRINHLRDCLLCHSPSFDRADLVRGAVPTPGEALPAAVTTPQYYERGGTFVRADVTYLRQDFSVFQPVENNGVWPAHQRYDYLVRLTPLTFDQAEKIRSLIEKEGDKVPAEKETIRWVLRELTGKDKGFKPKDWGEFLPKDEKDKIGELESRPTGNEDWRSFLPKTGEKEQSKLLVQELEQNQDRGLKKIKEAEQDPFDAILLEALPKLSEGTRAKARDLLVERLEKLPSSSLTEKYQSDSAELRRAAVLACARKGDKNHIPSLIPLLADQDEEVVQAAREALKTLGGQDFGPPPKAGAEERVRAVQKWQAWWKKQTS